MHHTTLVPHATLSCPPLCLIAYGLTAILSVTIPLNSDAQVTTSITPTTDSTTVINQAGPLYNITGGTRADQNLFHSFGNFSVGAAETANFLNTPVNGSLPLTSNILGRVTGGNASTLFGTIQTTNFGNANLFLMNPAGFLFGPNATVNVGGMVAFTTADYLRHSDGILFNNTPNVTQDVLLSAAPVAAFGFLGSNAAAIAIQGSTLQVAQDQTLSFVGGNQGFMYMNPDTGDTGSVPGGVMIRGAKLSAPGGQINVAGVASSGEISSSIFQPSPNIQLGPVSISEGSILSVLDVSGDAAGTVRIRAGQLVMHDATISADTVNKHGAPLAVDIHVTDGLSITTTASSAITARTTGAGDAGEVKIVAGNMSVTAISQDLLSIIDTHTSGTGKAGNVSIDTADLQVAGDPEGLTFFIDSGTSGKGAGENIAITASNVIIDNASISTGDADLGEARALGSAGNIEISADSINLTFSNIKADSFAGSAGDITLAAQGDLRTESSGLAANGFERNGAIEIQADRIVMQDSHVESPLIGSPGSGEGVLVTGRYVELNDASTITTTTLGGSNAGPIHVTATEQLSLVGTSEARTTGIFGNSLGLNGALGDGGDVFITTPRLEITGGARINTATRTNGGGGNVTIDADAISISGQLVSPPSEEFFGLGDQLASGIFTSTIGTAQFCAGACGEAGHISIITDSLTMFDGGHINSGTSSSGRGGNISVQASEQISLSGTLRDGTPVGIFSHTIGTAPDSGSGGNITLTAGQSVTISDGASVSASSTGPGNAGNIRINAGQTFVATNSNSAVTTQADAASGGNIKVLATEMIQLTNSRINASVEGSKTTVGGNIMIDPQVVILQNSQIVAEAIQGKGGNISITTNLLLPDANSRISASSQFGVNGTVTIQSPNSPASGKIQPLGNQPLEATSLLSQRCAALAGGEFSSFTVAGRDILPAEPSHWLASPLATLSPVTGPGVKGERERSVTRGEGLESVTMRASLASESPYLSLRQIAPTGFLTQAFAVDRSTGCQS